MTDSLNKHLITSLTILFFLVLMLPCLPGDFQPTPTYAYPDSALSAGMTGGYLPEAGAHLEAAADCTSVPARDVLVLSGNGDGTY